MIFMYKSICFTTSFLRHDLRPYLTLRGAPASESQELKKLAIELTEQLDQDRFLGRAGRTGRATGLVDFDGFP